MPMMMKGINPKTKKPEVVLVQDCFVKSRAEIGYVQVLPKTPDGKDNPEYFGGSTERKIRTQKGRKPDFVAGDPADAAKAAEKGAAETAPPAPPEDAPVPSKPETAKERAKADAK